MERWESLVVVIIWTVVIPLMNDVNVLELISIWKEVKLHQARISYM